jgi:hypothetical protein
MLGISLPFERVLCFPFRLSQTQIFSSGTYTQTLPTFLYIFEYLAGYRSGNSVRLYSESGLVRIPDAAPVTVAEIFRDSLQFL